MNPCHYCSCLPSIQQIISCCKCQFSFCLKCVRRHIQTSPSSLSLQSIKNQYQKKAWQCFSCSKTCLCRQCKMNMNQIQRIILNKKQQALKYQKNYLEYKERIECLEIFKEGNNKFEELSLYEKQYFVNKVMLYGKQSKGIGNNIGEKKSYQSNSNTNGISMNGNNVMVIESEENQDIDNNININNNNININISNNNKNINNINKIIQQPSQKPINPQQQPLFPQPLIKPTSTIPIIIDIDQQDQPQQQPLQHKQMKPQQQYQENIKNIRQIQIQHHQQKQKYENMNVNNPKNSNINNC